MSTDPTSSPAKLTDVPPDVLEQWLAAGDTVLIDVREDHEHAEERIPAAMPMPLSKFDAEALRTRHPNARVVFHCRSGKRSAQAAQKFATTGGHVYHLAGGIDAWKAAGKPTHTPASAPKIPVMRQVQIVAGSLVTLGVALGVTLSPWFLILSAFVGTGLVFAGATGWCGMAMMLAKMPWNRPRKH